MASTLKTFVDALKAQIVAETSIVSVDDENVESNEVEAKARVKGIDLDLDVAVGGSSFMGVITVEVYVSGNDIDAAWELIEEFASPDHATNSIERAIDTDNTLGGAIDDIRVARIFNVGPREYPSGGFYIGADFVCRFIVQVLT